jgi:hypothetical protein
MSTLEVAGCQACLAISVCWHCPAHPDPSLAALRGTTAMLRIPVPRNWGDLYLWTRPLLSNHK